METELRPGPARTTRLDFESLERFLRGADEQIRKFLTIDDDRVAPSAIAAVAGINRQSVYRYREDGVPYYSADRIACHMGVHPTAIWPNFHEETQCPT